MSDKIKHTPGPWRVSHGNAYNSGLYVVAGVAAEVCEVFDDAEEMALPDEANARLIAAAPEMLEALKRVVHDWDGEPEDMAEAQAAIAKAEGGHDND